MCAISAAQLEVKFNTHGVSKTRSDIDAVGNSVEKADKKTGNFFSNLASTAGGFVLAGAFTALTAGATGFASSLIMANANAETFRNQLNIAVGDAGKAGELFDWLKQMAKDTPFEFPELIQGAANLEALGQSSQKWLPIIGDTAAATNKSIDQTVQAVLDAQTGEFERLKEFGIRSKVEGDKVVFSFMQNGKEMQVTADNTSEGISSALMGIWDNKYDGAMDKMSNTFAGRMSTLKDNINMTLQDLGKPLFDFASTGLAAANTFFSNFSQYAGTSFSTTEKIFLALKDTMIDVFGPKTGVKINKFLNSLQDTLEDVSDIVSDVADVFRSVLGRAFDFLRDRLNTIIPAVKALGLAFAVFLGWGAITAIIAGIGAVLGALLSPVVLLAGAIAALGIAWNENFLGIRDIVADVAGKVTGWLDGIAVGAKTKLGELTGAFKDARDFGLNPFEAAFKSVYTTFGIVQPLFDALTPAVLTMYDAFAKFKEGDIAGGFRDLGTAAKEAFSGLWDLVSGIDWGGILSGISDGAGQIASWFWDQVSSVDWGGLFKSAIGVLGDAGIWILEKLGSIVAFLGTWIVEQVQGVDWSGAFSSGWSVLSSAGSWLGAALGEAITALGTWIVAQVQGVDWQGAFTSGFAVLSSIGQWLATAMGTATDKIQTWLEDQFIAVNWEAVGDIVGTNLRTAIRDSVQNMPSISAVILSWMSDGMRNVSWEDVGELFGSLFIASIKVPILLATFPIYLLAQLLLAIVNTDWTSVGSAFKAFFVATINALKDFFVGWGKKVGAELIKAIGDVPWASIGSAIKDGLVGSVKGIGGAIWDKIWGEFSDSSSGADLGQGVADAIGNIIYAPPGYQPPDENGPQPVPVQEGGTGMVPDLSQYLGGTGNPLAGLKDLIGKTLAEISGMITTGAAAWSTALNTGLLTMQTGAMTSMSAITLNITTALTTITSVVATNVAAWSTAMQTGLLTMQTGVMTSMAAINTNISSALTTAASTVASKTADMRSKVESAFSEMASRVSSTTSQMRSTVESAMSAIASIGKAKMQDFASGVRSGMDRAVDAVRDGLSRIQAAVSGFDIYDEGHGIGVDFSAGLRDGILSMAGEIASAAAQVVTTAIAAARLAQLSSSPSKVMRETGQWFTQGFALGIADDAQKAIVAATNVVGGAIAAATTSMGGGTHFGDLINGKPGIGSGSFGYMPAFDFVPTTPQAGVTYGGDTFSPTINVSVSQQPGENQEEFANRIAVITMKKIGEGIGSRRLT